MNFTMNLSMLVTFALVLTKVKVLYNLESIGKKVFQGMVYRRDIHEAGTHLMTKRHTTQWFNL